MMKRVKTTWMEFFRTGKRFKEIEVHEPDIIQKPKSWYKDYKKTFRKPKVKPVINSYWKLIIFYKSGDTSEIKTTIPDSEYLSGEDYFKPFLEWFMCSTNPYYLIKHILGTRIYVRSSIAEINVIKITTEDGKEKSCEMA